MYKIIMMFKFILWRAGTASELYQQKTKNQMKP